MLKNKIKNLFPSIKSIFKKLDIRKIYDTTLDVDTLPWLNLINSNLKWFFVIVFRTTVVIYGIIFIVISLRYFGLIKYLKLVFHEVTISVIPDETTNISKPSNIDRSKDIQEIDNIIHTLQNKKSVNK